MVNYTLWLTAYMRRRPRPSTPCDPANLHANAIFLSIFPCDTTLLKLYPCWHYSHILKPKSNDVIVDSIISDSLVCQLLNRRKHFLTYTEFACRRASPLFTRSDGVVCYQVVYASLLCLYSSVSSKMYFLRVSLGKSSSSIANRKGSSATGWNKHTLWTTGNLTILSVLFIHISILFYSDGPK